MISRCNCRWIYCIVVVIVSPLQSRLGERSEDDKYHRFKVVLSWLISCGLVAYGAMVLFFPGPCAAYKVLNACSLFHNLSFFYFMINRIRNHSFDSVHPALSLLHVFSIRDCGLGRRYGLCVNVCQLRCHSFVFC